MFVVLSDDVCLRGHVHEFFVRGQVIAPVQTPVNSASYVFNPDQFTMSRKDIVMAKAIVRPEREFIPVKIFKPEFVDIYLKKGTKLGELDVLNESGGYYEDVRMIKTNEVQNSTPSFVGSRVMKVSEEVNIGDLPSDVQKKLLGVLNDYQDVFSSSKMDIGCTSLVQHTIDTGDSYPIAVAPRRIPMALEEKVDKMIEDLLKNDIIQPSESPWNAPLVIVAKKNSDIRLCVDYRKLNAVTKRPVYPIPATNQLLDCLNGSMYFTTLDLSQGYYQIPMAPEDMPNTAFATRKGQYEYKRMPMGLASAPGTFQRLMHIAFKNENWEKCLIYLDDVLIHGRSVDEHLERVKAVLQRVREAGLKLSPAKCTFMKQKVEYLGHVITTEGIQTDSKKVEKVQSWPTPTTVKQLKSFLGLSGYYRRFIKDYAQIVRPLELLCAQSDSNSQRERKNPGISAQWNDTHHTSFIQLKKALTSAPLLAYPMDNEMFILDTDASNIGIGAVLSQIQGDQERVIAYASRRLSKSERRYCTTRKELLAVIFFVRHFKHYLFGRKFQVRTDHRALLWMLNWKKPNTSQFCLWKAELELYDLEVVHRPGKLHMNADALSRLPQCQQCELKHENPQARRQVKVFENDQLSQSASSNQLVLQLAGNVELPNWNFDDDEDTGVIIKLMKDGKLCQESIPDEIKLANMKTKELWKMRENLRLRGEALYILENSIYKLVVPRSARRRLIAQIHQCGGHTGVNKTANLLKNQYYWPGMMDDVKIEVQCCPSCQIVKGKNGRDRAPLQPSLVGEPFERIAIDISGPYQKSRHGHRYILAIIDYFSKYPVLIPLRQVDAETVARKVFQHWISIFGAPQIIHSDRGTNFESALFKQQCELFGIKKTRTSPYFPQADGLVERLFRTIKPMISAVVHSKKMEWCEALPFVEMGLRSSNQSSIGISPFEVLFGKLMKLPVMWESTLMGKTRQEYKGQSEYISSLRDKLETIRQTVAENILAASNKQAGYYNNHKRAKEFTLGEKVFIKVENYVPGKFPIKKFSGPYEVVGKRGHWSYTLKHLTNGKVIDRNYNQMKRMHGSLTKNRKVAVRSKNTSIQSLNGHSTWLTDASSGPLENFTAVQPYQTSSSSQETIPMTTRYPIRRQRAAPARLGFPSSQRGKM